MIDLGDLFAAIGVVFLFLGALFGIGVWSGIIKVNVGRDDEWK